LGTERSDGVRSTRGHGAAEAATPSAQTGSLGAGCGEKGSPEVNLVGRTTLLDDLAKCLLHLFAPVPPLFSP
jgi:hypothetical protein